MLKKVKKGDSRFLCTYTQGNSLTSLTQVWVDKKTGVNYVFHAHGSYAGGLTPLLNPDGTPVVTPISRYEE